MNRHLLREIAKVGFGLVLADILSGIFLSAGGFLPLTILGVEWTGAMMPEVIFFDAALLVFLFHYGWNARLPISSPSERTLLSIAGVIFGAVALVHLARLAFGWPLILGNFVAPAALSWFGVIFAGYLSYASFHFAFKKR
jgi:hypothetical protein